MRRLLCFLLMAWSIGSARGDVTVLAALSPSSQEPRQLSPTAPSGALLLFRNGDLLHGGLHSIEPGGAVRWVRPDFLEPVAFKLEGLTEVLFHSDSARLQRFGGSTCQISLTNGDHLYGTVERLDEENLIFRTWYAGEMTIPRKRVRWIEPELPERAILFEGPNGVDGWTMGKVQSVEDAGEWQYRAGAFYGTRSASIARDFDLPDLVSIQFALAWRGTFQMAIALYTDTLQPINLLNKENEEPFGAFYSLQMDNFRAGLVPVSQHKPHTALETDAYQIFNQKDSAQIEIRVNKSKALIALMVDGVLVKQWVDPQGFIAEGSGLRIVHNRPQQSRGQVRLSNLRIAEWDGQFEERPAYDPASTEDQARFRNGDRLAGSLNGIQDGKVSFTGNGSTLEVPLARVRRLDLAGKTAERADGSEFNVRLFLPQGGRVALNLEKWDATGVVGSSSNFGKLTWNPSAFERIEFRTREEPE